MSASPQQCGSSARGAKCTRVVTQNKQSTVGRSQRPHRDSKGAGVLRGRGGSSPRAVPCGGRSVEGRPCALWDLLLGWPLTPSAHPTLAVFPWPLSRREREGGIHIHVGCLPTVPPCPPPVPSPLLSPLISLAAPYSPPPLGPFCLPVPRLLWVLRGAVHCLLLGSCAGDSVALPGEPPPVPAPGPGAKEPLGGESCSGAEPAGWDPQRPADRSHNPGPGGQCVGHRTSPEGPARSQGLTCSLCPAQ